MSSSSLIDSPPAQCSLWFEPKQWSPRYEETFFTASITAYQVQENAPLFTIEMKAGALNRWTVEKNQSQMEEFAKQVRHQISTHRGDRTLDGQIRPRPG